MGTIIELPFPPQETSREVFLTLRQVIPALRFIPHDKVGLNDKRAIVAQYRIHLDYAVLMAGSLVMEAANQAMESLECSVDDITDILKSEPFKHSVELLFDTIDFIVYASENPPLFDYIWKNRVSNIQKTIETIFPEVKRKKAQSLAGKKTGENHSVIRELFIKRAILLVEKDKTCRYNDVIEDGKVTIRPKCRELNIKIPRDPVLRKWLKAAEKEGRLAMPPTASKPGRPTK